VLYVDCSTARTRGAIHSLSNTTHRPAHTPHPQVWTEEKEVTAQTVIIATGAVAKRLPFKGSDEVRLAARCCWCWYWP